MRHSRVTTAVFYAFTALFLVAATPVRGQDAPDRDSPKVDVTKITDNIYLLVCSTQFTSNCIALTGDNGILLIDTGMQPAAELLREELNKLDSGPVKYIIHTHGHPDHTGANALLGETATVIAHENLKKGLKRGYGLLTELPEHAQPGISFYKDYSLRFNGEEIELLFYSGGHTDNDVVVHFTKSGVVCTGGLFSPGNFPYVEGDAERFTKNIFKIMTKYPKDAIYVPSHGSCSTAGDLKEFYDMLLETTATVQRGLDDGKDVDAMQAENILKEWDSWGDGFVSGDLWIQSLANSLTGDAEPPRKPILEPLYYTLQKGDAAAAIEQYHQLKKRYPDDYDYSEANLNAIGYYLLGKERYEDAIALLALNIELFPASANPYDSLGEAYIKKGDEALAIKYYEKAIEIDPQMPSAIRALKQLKEE